MNWFSAAILAVGLLVWCLKKNKRTARPVPEKAPEATEAEPEAEPKSEPEAEKGFTPEQVDELTASNDPDKMASALEQISDPLHRHYVLSALVSHFYPQRSEPEKRARLYQYGKTYLQEFDRMVPALKTAAGSAKMDVPVFKSLTIAMEEDQRYDEALDICRRAVARDLEDGTKTGYPGRINRLTRKKQTTS